MWDSVKEWWTGESKPRKTEETEQDEWTFTEESRHTHTEED